MYLICFYIALLNENQERILQDLCCFERSANYSSCLQAAKITKSREQAALFVVPSIIYWLHNNVQFLTLKYVDAPTYQILGNLKIVTTGLLFWLCLRRRLTPLQWMALLLLMMGAATSQVKFNILPVHCWPLSIALC